MGCFMCAMDSSWDKAMKKAEDPRMTTAGNPLAAGVSRDEQVRQDIRYHNMHRLEADAAARRGPHGSVYAGMMDTRYKEK